MRQWGSEAVRHHPNCCLVLLLWWCCILELYHKPGGIKNREVSVQLLQASRDTQHHTADDIPHINTIISTPPPTSKSSSTSTTSLTISILSRSWSRSSVCLFGIQVRDHLRHSCWYEQTEDHAASFNIHLDVLSFGVVDLTVSVLVEHYSHFITL